MDIKRLSRGEQILGGAALLLLISSFIPMWAKIELEAGALGDLSERFNAWDAYGFFPLKLGLLLAVVAVIWVLVRAAGVNMNLPTAPGMIAVGLGGLTLLMLLLSLLTGPAGGSGGFGFEISRGVMLFVGVVLAAAMAYGGYLAMQEDSSGAGTTAFDGPAAPPPGPPPPG